MGYDFRPAVREHASVLVGLAGASGSGKTLSALKLATGLAGPGGRIAFIDTERGRALHYAPARNEAADPSKGTFAFDHLELNAPFTPEAYMGAIEAAEKLSPRPAVIIVDSFSHEWEGQGGVLDMQEAEFQRMGGSEKVKISSWIKPKGSHKRMINRLVQCQAHLLICLRAQEKMKLIKDADGKQKVIAAHERPVKERWEPICEKRFMYELTVSFVLTPTDPGIPVPVKLQDQHKPFFPADRQISEEAGRRLALWSSGGRIEPDALTKGEVRQLEQLIEKAAAANRITPEDVEGFQLAIHDKNTAVIRDGIRELTERLQGAQAGLGV